MKLSFLREPLLHFLVLGAALFGLFNLVDKKNAEAPSKIVVSAARISTLADQFSRTWRRPPTDEEMQGLVEDYIRDEIFYREGRIAGLDRDDFVIRRRVRQKMEFLATDEAAENPSDEQLASYLASNRESFRTEDRLTFRQIFLSATRRGSALDADAKRIAETLAQPNAEMDAAIGDSFLLGDNFRGMSESDTARTFGEGFSRQIAGMETGRWRGPIASSFGAHFVLIDERVEGGLPPLEAVREAVRREWMNARRTEAEAKFYRTMRNRYTIEVERPVKAASFGALR
jgi:PPIC-type PPIASE domain